jgi:arsenate reductase (glutaredoxin)
MTLYGLPTCDTCRNALKRLKESGRGVTFRDIRAEPLSGSELQRLDAAFPSTLINRRSKTWRDLPEAERSGDPLALLSRHPALMKRPVIEEGGRLHLGWGPEVRAALLP